MKRISTAAVAILALLTVCASAYAASVDEVLAGLQSYWTTIDTFTARFVQKKHLALFTDDVTSRGTFYYKNPGDMVFRYDPPDDAIIGIKLTAGLIINYSPEIKRAQRIHFPPGAAPSGMSFGLGPTGDVKGLKDAATVTVAEASGLITLTMAPTDPKAPVREVSLKRDYTPVRVKITEKTGDFTVIEFSEQRINPPVSDALFDVKIPRGVTVEEIGK